MTTLASRLQLSRKNSGFTQVQLAKLAGVSQNAIQKIESGQTKEPKNILALAKALGIEPEWLQYGTGKQTKIETNRIESNVKEIGSFELWDCHTPLNDDEVEVPFLKDIRFAASNGFTDDIMDYNHFKLRFSKAILRRQGVQYNNAVCITADGDSMEPVIPDGSTVAIDIGNRVIRDGKIYAINHGGLLRIKILYKMPNEQVRIRSYNIESTPEEVVDLSKITVLGKVFWWSVLCD